jgi:hypothetical protein
MSETQDTVTSNTADTVSERPSQIYALPSWYSNTLLWLWPYLVVGGFMLGIDKQEFRVHQAIWWIGLLAWTGLFFLVLKAAGSRRRGRGKSQESLNQVDAE